MVMKVYHVCATYAFKHKTSWSPCDYLVLHPWIHHEESESLKFINGYNRQTDRQTDKQTDRHSLLYCTMYTFSVSTHNVLFMVTQWINDASFNLKFKHIVIVFNNLVWERWDMNLID